MLTDAVAVLAVAALCAGWVLFQRWIARLDPELPGIQRSCSGCAVPGAPGCREECAAHTAPVSVDSIQPS